MSEITNKLRGEVPFPEGGPGVVLRYRNHDLLTIQKEFGDQWFLDAGEKLNRWDMVFMEFALKMGTKDAKGKAVHIPFDELDVPMIVIAERILDGLYTSMFGETYQQHIQRVGAALANFTDGDTPRPPPSPANISSTSDERPSGLESGLTNSGISSPTKSPSSSESTVAPT